MSSTGRPAPADLGQQRVVLHVARADLDHVRHLEDRLEVALVHQLGDDRQPGLGLGLGEQPQPLLAEALEGVRRGARLVGAAAEQRARRRPGRPGRSRASARATRPCTARRSARSCWPPILRPAMSSTVRSPCLNWVEDELVRLEDRDDPLDARGCPRARAAATCSRSPIAPITVISSPRLGWARAPTLWIRSMTAWISSSVASVSSRSSSAVLSGAWKRYESGLGGFHPTGGFFGARLGGGAGPLTIAGEKGAGRLAKSPGVRVAAEMYSGAATATHRRGFCTPHAASATVP